ncbi:helix-turn-helix domain-containing protein [Burkholderia cenocepacia]|uniref:helix-turn-helix domain-containing protein n=1 Tax=Burkholderia cenocepacia TaxID=95486 RepID=UPI002010DDBE|nr:helix-turn-helix transcriptional regulator [Burkholderia cenocepacia]
MIDQDKMRALAARQREEAELSDFQPNRKHYAAFMRESADAIDLLLAEVEAIEQAILDPENQPSQYGTVLLESARKESDSLMSALAECREAMPHRDSCDAELMQAIGDPGAVPIYVKAVVATLRAELEAAAADKREEPSLTNPLTPYGLLVRALRIVAGITLMDMATALLTTPAKLSAMEFGRTPVTPEFAFDVSAYFDALGVPHTASALRAAIEAPPLFKLQEES